jgi:hypothetical protein
MGRLCFKKLRIDNSARKAVGFASGRQKNNCAAELKLMNEIEINSMNVEELREALRKCRESRNFYSTELQHANDRDVMPRLAGKLTNAVIAGDGLDLLHEQIATLQGEIATLQKENDTLKLKHP